MSPKKSIFVCLTHTLLCRCIEKLPLDVIKIHVCILLAEISLVVIDYLFKTTNIKTKTEVMFFLSKSY